MEIQRSDIVRAEAGRDAGGLFFAVGVDGEYALLADGWGRKIEKPKRKKLKHMRFAGTSDSRTAEKLRRGEKVTNSELRRALADFAARAQEQNGGM